MSNRDGQEFGNDSQESSLNPELPSTRHSEKNLNDLRDDSDQERHSPDSQNDVVDVGVDVGVEPEIITDSRVPQEVPELQAVVQPTRSEKYEVKLILDDPVTSHMSPAHPLLTIDQTVEEALNELRRSKMSGRIIYFYVVDHAGKLEGVVATRKLLLSPLTLPISEILSRKVIAIPSSATVFDACNFFTLHKLLAFPVVDDNHHIVGMVDVDLYTKEILEFDRRQDSDDLFQLIGLHLSTAVGVKPLNAFWGRFPWLFCNVIGGMLAAVIADIYDDVSTLIVVAPFIALVTAVAESVSIQSVSIAMQALHSQTANWNVFWREVRKEVSVTFLLGTATGLAVALIALVWKQDVMLSGSLLIGVFVGIMASAMIGLSMPFVLRMFQRDPQLACGPMALALSDIVTLICYFTVGRWMLL